MPSTVLDDLFFRDPFFNEFTSRVPAMDVKETEKEYIVEAEVPGIPKENIDIQVLNDNTLVVSGHYETNEEPKEKEQEVVGKETYLTSERSTAAFKRQFVLDSKLDPEKISAQLKDGILKVTVPKEEIQIKKIQIQ
jgi:HSP20 family protein